MSFHTALLILVIKIVIFEYLYYYTLVQKAEYPFLSDWFAISLRWLVLLGIVNSLLVARSMDWKVTGIVLFVALWNIFNTVLAMLNIRLAFHREINVGVDFLVNITLFFFSGGLTGVLAWCGLMSIFSTAIYYGWLWSILAGVLLTIAQLAGTLLGIGAPVELSLEIIGILAGFNVACGAVFGVLSSQLYRQVRQNYQGQLTRRQEKDRHLRRSERESMRTLYDLIETLSATVDYQTVLENILDLSATALGITQEQNDGFVSTVLLFEEQHLHVGTARGFSSSDMRAKFPAEKGILQEVVEKAEPRQLIDPKNDPELINIGALQNCQSVLLLPLRRGLNAYGVMLFAHHDPQFFSPERSELLEMISHQAVVAIQNALLFKDLESEKQRIISTQEEERRQLARSLHDGPTQSVSGIAMRANYVQKLFEHGADQATLKNELAHIEDLARRTTQEIRHMLFILRPLVLESEGLVNAFKAMADKMLELYQQNVVLEIDPDAAETLDIRKQTVVFQIVEEAINNARKHAQAKEIRVKLNYIVRDKSLALLEIIDNGVGFSVDAVNDNYEHRGSLGMVNLRERTELINGVLHIDSVPGKGTSIQVAIPYTNEAVDRLQRSLAKS
jgi:signal transduction histidine kinase